MKRSIVGFAAGFAAVLVACGSNGGLDGDAGGGGDGGGTPSGDGAGEGATDHAGLCNDVALPTPSPQISLVDGVVPTESGGAIRDGRYELESVLVYVAGGDGGPSVNIYNQAIAISGHQWASVSYFDSFAITWYNDEATLSGNSVSLRRTCGDAAGGFFGAAGTYTASDSELIVNFPAQPQYGPAVLTFRRSPDPDGGENTCIGEHLAPTQTPAVRASGEDSGHAHQDGPRRAIVDDRPLGHAKSSLRAIGRPSAGSAKANGPRLQRISRTRGPAG